MARVRRRLNKAQAIQILIARLLAEIVQFLSNLVGGSSVAGEADAELGAERLVESVYRGARHLLRLLPRGWQEQIEVR